MFGADPTGRSTDRSTGTPSCCFQPGRLIVMLVAGVFASSMSCTEGFRCGGDADVSSSADASNSGLRNGSVVGVGFGVVLGCGGGELVPSSCAMSEPPPLGGGFEYVSATATGAFCVAGWFGPRINSQNRDRFFGSAAAETGFAGMGLNSRGTFCDASFGGACAVTPLLPSLTTTSSAFACLSGATNVGCTIAPLSDGNLVVG